jgi:hypothetical protein
LFTFLTLGPLLNNHSVLSFEDIIISRLHFRIYSFNFEETESDNDEVAAKDGSQTFPHLIYCEDRMSSNGTYVNSTLIGKQSCPRSPYLLTDGDTIAIRPHWKFRFNQWPIAPLRSFDKVQVNEMKVCCLDRDSFVLLTSFRFLTSFTMFQPVY